MPPLWLPKLGAVLALLAGAWAHGYRHGGERQQRLAAAAVQAATDAARAEESRRVMRLQEAQDAEHLARQAAQRDAAAARAAADSLRQRAADFAALPSDAASAAGCPATDDRARVLADLLGRAAARADELAGAADSARLAGQLCERAYDALTVR
jgi:hypothetical protein